MLVVKLGSRDEAANDIFSQVKIRIRPFSVGYTLYKADSDSFKSLY